MPKLIQACRKQIAGGPQYRTTYTPLGPYAVSEKDAIAVGSTMNRLSVDEGTFKVQRGKATRVNI